MVVVRAGDTYNENKTKIKVTKKKNLREKNSHEKVNINYVRSTQIQLKIFMCLLSLNYIWIFIGIFL